MFPGGCRLLGLKEFLALAGMTLAGAALILGGYLDHNLATCVTPAGAVREIRYYDWVRWPWEARGTAERESRVCASQGMEAPPKG